MDLQLSALNMSNSTKQVKVIVTSRVVTTSSCVCREREKLAVNDRVPGQWLGEGLCIQCVPLS